jgi:hypothetical protein
MTSLKPMVKCAQPYELSQVDHCGLIAEDADVILEEQDAELDICLG